jgi:hypothetical protein
MGSGAPNPKGKQIPEVTVTDKTNNDGWVNVEFSMPTEDAAYFEVGKTYKLVAIEKE